ncbi:MAG TPA: tetratricopeptide repeat protein [Bacteroidales bacterium]|nr:tetratricopeptide repeat protein [Bacteroidales bacterium]
MKHLRQIIGIRSGVLLSIIALSLIAGLCLYTLNFSANHSLFIESKNNPELLELNTNFIGEANSKEVSGEISCSPFKKIKGQNTIRIFVIGDPVTNKFPNNPNAGFPHILNNMLQQNIEGKSVELIHVSFRSASSFVQYDIAHQLKKYSPDIVIICPGRDEFYGDRTYSTNSFLRGDVGFNRYFGNLRVVRMIRKLFKDDTLEYPAGIAPDSRSFQKSLAAFEKNLDDMVLMLQKNGSQIVLLNSPANLLDAQPQKSCFTAPDSAKLAMLFSKGKLAYLNHDYESAQNYFGQILQRDKGHAETLYYLGKLALSKNDNKAARKYLEQARESDWIRFRSSANINQIIFRTSVVRGCLLVDVEKSFSAFSNHGIAGQNLFSGPQQTNLAGNILMAKTCFESLLREHCIDCIKKSPVNISLLTPFDSLYDDICAKLAQKDQENEISISSQLFTTFEEQTVSMFANRETSWDDSMNKLYDYYISNRNYELALRVAENLVLENPFNAINCDNASKMAALLGDSQRVVYYADKAYKKHPSLELAQRLFIHCLKLDKPENALPYLMFARKHHVNKNEYNHLYDVALRIVDLKKMLRKNPSNDKVRKSIASQYYSIGNREIADGYSKKREKLPD